MVHATGLETLSRSALSGPDPGVSREVGALSLDGAALARDCWQL